MEYIGWIGSILFAVCGLPQAIDCYKRGNSHGLTWSFIMMWFWGEVFTMIYVIPKGDLPLIFNYVFNMAFLLVIIFYKLFPRNTK